MSWRRGQTIYMNTPAGSGLVEDAVWNLRPLMSDTTLVESLWAPTISSSERLSLLLDEADRRAAALQSWRGRVSTASADDMVQLMSGVAAVIDLLGRTGSFAVLDHSTNSDDQAKGALVALATERATAIENQLRFVDLEWSATSDAHAAAILDDPALAFCAHSLRVTRAAKPHLLSEPEEKVLADKNVTGAAAWTRLYNEVLAGVTVDFGEGPVSYEYVFPHLMSTDAAERKATAEKFSEALAPGLRTRAFIFNTLMADRATEDRLRAYPSWVSSRNLSNQASDASVEALVSAVSKRFEIARRWYRVKAKLLKVDRLRDYDRMAPVGSVFEDHIEWAAARDEVLEAFASFSPTMAKHASGFFDGRIHAPMVPGKRGGAFCSPNVPSTPGHVFLNYTGTRNDVLTLAHELGHGVHFEMARAQGVFHHSTALTVAETASVFAEEVTFGRMLTRTVDPLARLSLLAEHVESYIATMFRQIALFRFEDRAHRSRRADGELSIETLGQFWFEAQSELLGDSVEVTDGYRSWWSYIPHFIHTPGYVYAYAFGQLLAMSVYQRYLDAGPSFVAQYERMLSLGGSVSPEELARAVDCDLTDPSFWDAGLDLVDTAVTEAEAAAAAFLAR
jgi:oligoendopeptidase F